MERLQPRRKRGPSRPRFETPPVDVEAWRSSPGWFKTRLCVGGHFIPARLWTSEERDEETGALLSDVRYFAEIDGRPTDPFEPENWPWIQITEEEFAYLTALKRWARQFAPNHPIANPTIPAHQLERDPKDYL